MLQYNFHYIPRSKNYTNFNQLKSLRFRLKVILKSFLPLSLSDPSIPRRNYLSPRGSEAQLFNHRSKGTGARIARIYAEFPKRSLLVSINHHPAGE